MFTRIATALVLTAALSGPVLAANPVILNDQNANQIRTMLTEQGYEVGKIKIEDGYYEAYAKKDGARFEIYLDGDFKVVRTKEDS